MSHNYRQNFVSTQYLENELMQLDLGWEYYMSVLAHLQQWCGP